MSNVIKVAMADLNVVTAPDTIRTSGLGSCVGLVLYDDLRAIAGMAHIMLPSSSLSKQEKMNEAKYADTAIPALLTRLEKVGARSNSLKAKLAGGAQMFSFSTGNDLMRIGPRNVEAIKLKLGELGIPIVSEDVGGKNGRTIEFDPASKKLHIRTVNKGSVDI
ncbi:chemotaxis protein CheD [Halalkalibacter akibai]|uniref:Probable chemoreceptor glutamine deamidase CheD n=1 Tax=Halalkalibacter akibai (strain ATCC 43226 / DSM 21942 / CIP 109018 / JCM 9157 / 1139) TaxID=1236973 RepID=W4QVE0_HALA3|nr:chemotaxis protein CheD [Halalkalibacter akibai]GAE36051.1 chemotaxis protein CheD [Halalkalibacter akibai JCM 9157]